MTKRSKRASTTSSTDSPQTRPSIATKSPTAARLCVERPAADGHQDERRQDRPHDPEDEGDGDSVDDIDGLPRSQLSRSCGDGGRPPSAPPSAPRNARPGSAP